MIVAVTGASGFIGRHIVDLLVERAHRPRALLRDPRQRPFARPERVEVVPGSITDAAAVDALVRGADAVIHLVGIIVEQGPQTFEAVHVEGTRSVVTAAAAAGVRRYVHMSAAGARDTAGATPYHRTKARAESVVRSAGLPFVIVRPAIVSGPGNAPIAVLAKLHRFLPLVPIFGDGAFPVQPVWIGDVALAFALAAEGHAPPDVYELGGPSVMPYSEFVRAIGRASGHPRPLVRVPLVLVRAAARVFDLLGPRAPITSDQLAMLVEGSVTPHNAIERTFGIAPLDFETGLGRYLTG